jgi:predicted PurR-regulated permease PerM
VSATTSPERQAARARADAAWADFRDRLHTVTPAALGRVALATTVTVIVASVVVGTWPALLPFVLGAIIAYAVLPLVDALDHLMPRALAAALAMLSVLAVVVGIFVIVVPPLVGALVQLTSTIPSVPELESRLDQLLAGLPEDARAVVAPIALEVARAAEDALAGASTGLDALVPAAIQAALGVVGAILGLIVLPAWILTLLTEKQRSAIAVDRRTAGWLRPDFWAIVRMFDRAVGTYLRGYVVVAFLVGIAVWAGLTIQQRLGGPAYPGALAIATLAGAVQVIPEVGPILGFLPALLLVAVDPPRAAIYIVVYVASRWMVGRTVGDRLMEGRLNVPGVVLIPGVVALGQFGLLWLLLSAPILAFGTDLVRYLHGRLSEPPRPAGVLPGQPIPAAATATPARTRTAAVYRGRAAAMSRRPAPAPTAATPATPATSTR